MKRKMMVSRFVRISRYIALLYVGGVVVIPIVFLLREAFAGGISELWAAMTDEEALAAFRLTFTAASIVAIVNAVLGTIAAYALVKFRFPGSGFLDMLVDLPFAVPTAVTGLTLAILLGPESTLGAWLGTRGWSVLYNHAAVYIAFIVVTIPFVIRAVEPLLLAMDPAEEEAAITLGANPFQRFVSIEFPVIRAGILSGTALAFSRSLGEFGVVVFIAGTQPFRTQVASTFIFSKIEQFDFRGASAAAVVVLAISFALLWLVRQIEVMRVEGES